MDLNLGIFFSGSVALTQKSPMTNHMYIPKWVLGRVKNVSKRVFKNLQAFFFAILCILMG